MQPWERRLGDLSHSLRQCAETYFDPELFRRSCNHFLMQSRTVNFLIQKNKASIPDFENWYGANVGQGWAKDQVMLWSKEARNVIEKEGDLETNSELHASLIFSYDESLDVTVECGRDELVAFNIHRLLKLASQRLPQGVAADAVVRIRRRWVANSLPAHELLNAISYVYGRQRTLCVELAKHLATELPESIPELSAIDELRAHQDLRSRFVKLGEKNMRKFTSFSLGRDHSYVAPTWLHDVANRFDKQKLLTTFETRMDYHEAMAEGVFNQFGNHMGMLWMYGDGGSAVDACSIMAGDQASKYLLWREVADRVEYLRPVSIIWITEAWQRKVDELASTPMHRLPILGEVLNLVGLDKSGVVDIRQWKIIRDSAANPRLEKVPAGDPGMLTHPNVLMPIKRAMAKIYPDFPISAA